MTLFDRDLSRPFTYLITPGSLTAEDFEQRSDDLLRTLDLAASAGVSAIQLREKRLPSRLVFDLAVRTKKLLLGRSVKCLLNERFDLALAAGLDGVHLTSTSIPLHRVRENVPPGFLVGISTHTVEEVRVAARAGADLAVFGPVFETPGKTSETFTDRLGDLGFASEASGEMILLGLGGVNEQNVHRVIDAGADGFAGIRIFTDPDAAVRVAGSCERRSTTSGSK